MQIQDTTTNAIVTWDVGVLDTLLIDPFSENIRVEITAIDANNGGEVKDTSDALVVTVYNRSDISLFANVTSPAGAVDLTVSTGQKFDLQYFVRNNTANQAGYENGNLLIHSTTNSLLTFNNSDSLVINNFAPGRDTTTVEVGNSGDVVRDTIHALISQPPTDINSGTPAIIRRESETINFQIVPRAELWVEFIGLNDTTNNIRLTDQRFSINAVVRNRGIAATSSGRRTLIATLRLCFRSSAR